MKSTVFLVVILLVFVITAIPPSSTLATDSADKEKRSLKEEYELQEKCGKRAEEVFKSENNDTNNIISSIEVHYENHYNKKSNASYYLYIQLFNKREDLPSRSSSTLIKTLYDINEHKECAHITIWNYHEPNEYVYHCSVAGKKCN